MAFEELKERHAAMWGAGPFEQIADTLAEMHDVLVAAVDAEPGDAWLDVGCGTGELAFRASATGADVTGCDLAPALVETARRQAAERRLEIPFEVADCENLPYADASFDIITSSVGAIFAPDHARVAAELARVCKPGGRLALSAWTTDGRIGDFFRVIASYSPPPVEGAGVSHQVGGPEPLRSAARSRFRPHDHAPRHAVGRRVRRGDVGRVQPGVRPDRHAPAHPRAGPRRRTASRSDRALRRGRRPAKASCSIARTCS